MHRLLSGAVLAVCLASAANAATMAEVNTLIEQANAALRAGGDNRATSLREAIERCKRALELLGEVDGISDEVRDRKSSDILSTLYWCRKMLPMDLSGHQKTGASKKAGAKAQPEREGAAPAKPKSAPVKTKEHDKNAFELVQRYAGRQPHDLEGIVIRYEGVAASYPNTKWGKKALDEAGKARQKLAKARVAVLAARRDQIQELRFADALAAIEKDRLSPRMKAYGASLDALAADVRSLQRLHAKVIDALKLSQVRLEEPLGDLGIEKKDGWLLGGDAEGLDVVLGEKSAPKTRWSWSEFGAKAMVRLGGRFVRGNNAEWTELVAVGATITEDHVLAHDLFGKLLVLAPERVTGLTGYFERATSGYKSSSEGQTAIRLGEAKNLVRKRRFEEAFALINEVRTDLASNSAMVEKLREVNDHRRKLMLRNKLNHLGKALSPFEKKVRAAFGGDVMLDEATGRIEVLYDFSDSRQLRDFGIAYLYGQWKKSSSGFQVAKGQLYALGKRLKVFWRFPVKDVDVQVDVTYFDQGGQFHLSVHNNDERYDSTTGGFADGEAGYVSRYSGLYSYSSSFRERAPMIWRPSETATVRMKQSEDGFDCFDLFFNGDYVAYAYCWSDAPGPGAIGFGFNGGKGAIDNILIRGTLDMQWFREYTSSLGRRR
ncbi:MAG: MCP four helix bundle domain-containing protein [Planctomycetota bacterium]|jgi:hypothetical protein